VETFYTDFHETRSINVEITDTNSFMTLSKVWISQSQTSRNARKIDNVCKQLSWKSDRHRTQSLTLCHGRTDLLIRWPFFLNFVNNALQASSEFNLSLISSRITSIISWPVQITYVLETPVSIHCHFTCEVLHLAPLSAVRTRCRQQWDKFCTLRLCVWN
jgi:hypothetical protein